MDGWIDRWKAFFLGGRADGGVEGVGSRILIC